MTPALCQRDGLKLCCPGTTGLGTQCSLKRPSDFPRPLDLFPLLGSPPLSPRCYKDEFTAPDLV